jgi:hypothetical protein
MLPPDGAAAAGPGASSACEGAAGPCQGGAQLPKRSMADRLARAAVLQPLSGSRAEALGVQVTWWC